VHRDRERLGRREARPELAVDQQRPHVSERDRSHKIFNVDAAIAQRSAVLVRFGDFRFEGDDAFETRAVVVCHELILPTLRKRAAQQVRRSVR
jgi:hypothetical protein